MSSGSDPPRRSGTNGDETAGSGLEAGGDADAEAVGSEMPDLGDQWTVDDLDEDWERRAVEMLEDVDFDTELGVELSRDALRLAQGELTRAEFNEKHHDDVYEEFGVDERPTTEAGGIEYESSTRTATSSADGSPLPSVPETDSRPVPSRRGILKSAGAAAAVGMTAGLAGCLDGAAQSTTADATSGEDGNDVQLGMAIDMNHCIACLKCVEACKQENDTDRGTHWMHVFRYEEDEFGDVTEEYMPRPCQHCSEPSCTYVCPTQARHKRSKDGLVLTDYDTCIGCKYCEVACPYGVNFLGKGEPTDKSPGFTGSATDERGETVGGPPPTGVMGKCTFCVHRQDDSAQRGTTACEDDCPVDAIHFGDMNDPESDPRAYLRENDEESRFSLLDQQGTEPNVVYLGTEPTKDAEPVDGPYTYEDLDMETLAESQNGGDGE
ncbi:4Fe-4S ferredoxin [Natronococcus pandeyae]|uniref:4Fe-4S ferredoxin n=1 Tax=Natronococcus pandeyae TaxID=2055836 RepID=A0A8J8TQQ7_9EURY|nr:4Fe-4S ferredoxin N-terminal domain-containing protein [Natronococcus pandeyae]TYL38753.1 4Fe-4S ferredoxin [Natronococcus pandeyae]